MNLNPSVRTRNFVQHTAMEIPDGHLDTAQAPGVAAWGWSHWFCAQQTSGHGCVCAGIQLWCHSLFISAPDSHIYLQTKLICLLQLSFLPSPINCPYAIVPSLSSFSSPEFTIGFAPFSLFESCCQGISVLH